MAKKLTKINETSKNIVFKCNNINKVMVKCNILKDVKKCWKKN